MNNIKCPLCDSDKIESLNFEMFPTTRCLDCKLEFVEDLSYDAAYYHDYFSRYRNDLNSDASRLRRAQYKIDAQHLSSILPCGSILDIGCSSGGFLQELDSAGEYILYGIDVDLSAVQIARAEILGKSNLHISHGGLLEAEFGRKFDAVVFRGTFQYLGAQLKETLSYVNELLDGPAKIFIYALPNNQSFIYKLLGEKWNLYNAKEHQLIFNSDSLYKTAEIFGYRINELSYPYLNTVYADPDKDYEMVKRIVRGETEKSTPFWGNLIQCVFEKIQRGEH